MAIAILGGFTTSTLLTLVVVPVLFSYVDNLQRSIVETVQHGVGRKRGQRKTGKMRSLPPANTGKHNSKLPVRK
jgi:hypothetical protein